MSDVYLLIDGQQQGPYTEEQARHMLASGNISPDLPAWSEGMEDWVQVQKLLEQVTETSESPGTMPRGRKHTYRYLGIGMIVAVAVSLMLLRTMLASRSLPPSTTSSISQTTMQSPVVEPSTTAVQPSVALPAVVNAPAVTPNVEDVKKWLEDKIEAYGGGGKFLNKSINLLTTRSYHDVRFDGGRLSWTSTVEFSNGVSNSYNVQYNLEAIEPGSFHYVVCDETKLQDSNSIDDPIITYDIDYTSKPNANPFYTDNPHKGKEFVIKDENIAKRVVQALNFLSTQAKVEPF